MPSKERKTFDENNGQKKFLPLRLKKLPPERELTLKEMPDELRSHALEHQCVQKVLSEPSYIETDSSTVCFKLEIKCHVIGFSLLDFWYVKKLPIDNTG